MCALRSIDLDLIVPWKFRIERELFIREKRLTQWEYLLLIQSLSYADYVEMCLESCNSSHVYRENDFFRWDYKWYVRTQKVGMEKQYIKRRQKLERSYSCLFSMSDTRNVLL